MGDNQHTQNIQINNVIGENEKCVFYFKKKNVTDFLANPVPFSLTKSLFGKIRDTFFIFTNNFIYLDILTMSTVSHYWLLVGRGQGCC